MFTGLYQPMVEAALTILTGTILYAGAHHLYLGTTRTSTRPHLQLAAMYLLLAGFVLASALLYQSQEINAQVHMARHSMTAGILLWVALIWYVAFYSRSKPVLLLDLLTAAWVIVLIRNISSPYGLLYVDIAPIALYAGVNSWWTAVSFTMLASLLFCFYASLRMYRRGNKQAAMALVSGLSILFAASLADHLLNTHVSHTLYLAPFGFIGFLLANSLYPILLDYQKRQKAIQPPVIYKLTFNPGHTAFEITLSDPQSPPGKKPEMAVAQAPEFAAATFLPDARGRCLRRQGPPEEPLGMSHSSPSALEQEAVDIAVIEPGTKAGSKDISGETGKQTPWQVRPTSKRGQSSLNTVSDNLIDIAVYATMVLNRFKRGDADPQVLEMLCKKIRSKAIKTRRMANKLSRPGKPGNDVM
jgi:hypothetical protein